MGKGNDDILSVLKRIAEGMEENKTTSDTPVEKQMAALEDFRTRKIDYQPGDPIKMNVHGEGRYKYPKAGQCAVVGTVFDKPVMGDQGHYYHGEILVWHNATTIGTYMMDYRCIEPALGVLRLVKH